jgi:hypothetical protein
MWPSRVAAAPASFLLAIGITLLASHPPSAAHAAPASGAGAPALREAVRPAPARNLVLVTVATDDKQRVPKPKDEPRHKPAPTDSKKSGDDDSSDNGGMLGDCIGECIGNCISNMFDSIFFPPKPAPAPEQALAPEPRAWVVDDHGWLRAMVPGDSVVLWRDPVAADHPEVEAGRLPDGAEVVVVDRHVLPDGIELRVSPADGVEPAGWIASAALSAAPRGATAPGNAREPAPLGTTAPAPPRPSYRDLHPLGREPRWALQVVPSLGLFGKRELAEEYDVNGDGQAAFEAHYLEFQPRLWLQWGVGVGFREGWGAPGVSYLTASRSDEPNTSRWRVLDFDLLVGQRWRDWKGGRLSWSVGPALFHVRETADLRSFANDSTHAFLGAHEEKLLRWAGGATMRLGAGWQVLPWLEVGVQAGGYVMAWTGRHEKSLTGDFVRGPVDGLDLGLALTYTHR